MANKGKSAKPFKNHPSIVPGTAFDAGRLIAQVPSWVRPRVDVYKDAEELRKKGQTKKSRDAMVMFQCKHCGNIGLARFDRLRDGLTKSCCCLEKLSDERYQNGISNWVFHLQTKDRKAMFEAIISTGTTHAAEIYGRSKRELDTLYRYERDRLALKFTPAMFMEIWRHFQTNSIVSVTNKYKITKGEALHIARTVNRPKEAAKVAAKAKWASMTTKEKDEITEIVYKGKILIADAIETATDGFKEKPFDWFCNGRFWGELTSYEFSNSAKYSFYGWIAAAIEGLGIDIAAGIFGRDVARFVEIIEQSVSNRVLRKSNFLKQLPAGEKAKANPKVARMARCFHPNMDAKAIALALNLYALTT